MTGRTYTPFDREKCRREGMKNDLLNAVELSMALAWPNEGWKAVLRTAQMLRVRAAAIVGEHWYLVRYLRRGNSQCEDGWNNPKSPRP